MTLLREIDYGTPKPKTDATVKLTIDRREVIAPEGASVMHAAMLAGIEVPKLCATDRVDAYGSCRLCLVEIDGRRGTPSSCTTPVEPGMSISTDTPRLRKLRRGVMELYISDHPLDCLTCAANGDCELQDMAAATGLRDVRYGYEGKNHLEAEKDVSNPYFSFDPAKCIVCARCCSGVMSSAPYRLSPSSPISGAISCSLLWSLPSTSSSLSNRTSELSEGRSPAARAIC